MQVPKNNLKTQPNDRKDDCELVTQRAWNHGDFLAGTKTSQAWSLRNVLLGAAKSL